MSLNEWESRPCAEDALKAANKKRRSLQEPKYELVEALQNLQVIGPLMIRHMRIFHCNFVARPKNGSECDNKLFFAEVKIVPKELKGGGLTGRRICSYYCILEEPSDSRPEARPSGCISWDKLPGRVHHPPNIKWPYGDED